jgi:hypothetical protein
MSQVLPPTGTYAVPDRLGREPEVDDLSTMEKAVLLLRHSSGFSFDFGKYGVEV